MIVKLSTYQTSFASALTDAEVKFVVIGGMAMKAHGIERETIDLDIFVSRTNENARRLHSVLLRFATAVDLRLTMDFLQQPMKLLPLFSNGIKEVDVLTSIGELDFDHVAQQCIQVNFCFATLQVIGLDDLLRSKRISFSSSEHPQARARDLKDIELILAHKKLFC